MFDQILAWVTSPPDSVALGALYDSVFVLDIARRWGKTALCLIILYCWAILLPRRIGRGANLTYATREKDQIKRIVLPLHRMLTAHAPHDMCPVHFGSHEGMGEGLYFPAQAGGSIIKLVGVDKDPHRLRGEGSDGGVFSEAGHMKDLHENVTSVFLPQFQQRPWARLILESSAPEEIDHDFDEHFVPDAKKRGAYVFKTLEDNTSLSAEDRARAYREAGGETSTVAKREYKGLRERDPEATVVPEFDETRHVRIVETPAFAIAGIAQDPGTRDLFGIVAGYWHPTLDIAVIQRSWAQRNVGTAEVAQVLEQLRDELWEQDGMELRWWDGPEEHQNPAFNVIDADLRLALDLNREYDMHARAADKSGANHGVGMAKLYSLRDGFGADKIAIDPRDRGPLREHLRRARWNDNRTDLARHPVFGHFDCLMALVYWWAGMRSWRNRNPNKQLVTLAGEGTVIGPNYKRPQTRAGEVSEKLRSGKKTPFSKCPVCVRWRRCEVWCDSGFYTCSQDCSDQWVNRNKGQTAR